MNKNILKLAVVALSVCFISSCQSKLDIPQHSVSDVESYYKTDDEAHEGIIACYDIVRTLDSGMGNSLQFFKTHLSDDIWSGGGGHYDGVFYQVSDYTFGADYGAVATMYENLYKLVYRANVVLEKVAADSPTMKLVRAEAKVFRAYAYFNLITLWGTPPLVDHTLGSDEYMQPNSTKEALWSFFETDLTEAITSGDLQQKSSLADKNYRVTKQFAQALLGKGYIFQGKYSEAAKILDEVIGSELYDLNPDLSNAGTPLGSMSMESLFEINCLNDTQNRNDNNAGMRWTMTGLRGEKYSYTAASPFASSTFGYQNPRKSLYDAFVAVEGVDGYRLKNTIATYDRMVNELGTKPILDITDNEGYWNYKYRILGSLWKMYFYANNTRVMKFNEVLLLAAEAHLNTNNAAKATKYINRIRTRAQAPQITGVVTMDDIKTESRLELCFEGQRFENLVRWGDAPAVLATNGERNPVLHPDGSVSWESYNDKGKCGFVQGKHELLPFPANETFVNKNIVQNPKW